MQTSDSTDSTEGCVYKMCEAQQINYALFDNNHQRMHTLINLAYCI